MARKHPGFKGAQAQIAAKEGIPAANAGAILAAGARKASAKAKKANPRLARVKGKGEPPESKAKERGESAGEKRGEKKRGIK